MKKFALFSIFLFIYCILQVEAQTHNIFQSDVIYGGYTMNGINVHLGDKEMKAKILIPPGSTISKVFLFATQDGVPNFFVPPRNVFINDSLFQHYEFSKFSKPFISFWGPIGNVVFDESYINVLDITNRFTYFNDTLYVKIQEINHDPYKGFIVSFTIVIIFENPALPKMGYTIVLNEQNVDHYLTYNVQFPHPIQNDKPVGFGIWGWHMCDDNVDGSRIYVNNQFIGRVGGGEPNASSWCSGVYPNFAHYNDSLFAFDGDTPDSLMGGPDATANIQHYIPHLTSQIQIMSNYQTPIGNDVYSNPVGGLFFTYATPCDTFTATVQPGLMNHLCPGDTLPLSASGGERYQWSPAVGLSCYDCPNPVFLHDSSMAYTVRIYQSDSCSKILPVKVNVNYPRFDFSVRPATCGLPNATVTAHPLWPQRVSAYTLGTTTQADSVFTQLYGGQSYALTLTDTQGCAVTKTVFVPETIPTFAGFIVQPAEGDAPLDVNFLYTGGNATHFHWYFGDGDSLYNSTQPTAQHTYPFAGTYQPYLIAWLHAPHCTDTFYQQVTVHPALQVSQLISPNNDGKNDTWLIQGIELYPNLAVKVFNRWGNEVYSAAPYHNDWAGDKLPSATYFWIVYPLGVDQTPEEEILKGYLELMR